MAKPNHARAPQGASRRRRKGVGPAWVRPLCRAQRAINASVRMIDSTLRTVTKSERCFHRRPLRTSRNLHEASGRLVDASDQLMRALRDLAATNECIARAPEEAAAAPELLLDVTERWVVITTLLQQASDGLFALHANVLLGLESGEFVPEQPAARRERIRLAPRPVAIRAFLLRRQPRVVDRIAPILRRRRRTPRPAAVRVPLRSLLGRAPPLF